MRTEDTVIAMPAVSIWVAGREARREEFEIPSLPAFPFSSPPSHFVLVHRMHLVRIGEREEEPKSTTKVIERVTEGIAKCKKSVILVGAGISTQAGIPVSRNLAQSRVYEILMPPLLRTGLSLETNRNLLEPPFVLL